MCLEYIEEKLNSSLIKLPNIRTLMVIPQEIFVTVTGDTHLFPIADTKDKAHGRDNSKQLLNRMNGFQ